MSDKALTVAQPAIPVAQAVEQYNQLVDFVRNIMQENLDFGVIPGTGNKPTLYKPGAEKLARFFGLVPIFKELQVVEDWTGEFHKGEPFFYNKTLCQLMQGDRVVAECIASANSWESRYRYRKASRQCPQCGKEAIIKGKVEYGGGWICFAKKGGCGYKFPDDDPRITSQVEGEVKNERIFDLVNTLQKMSQKRALVGATLIGTSASEFFTQDLEDIVYDGTYRVVEEDPKKESKPKEKRPTDDWDEDPPPPGDLHPAEQAVQAKLPAVSPTYQVGALTLKKIGEVEWVLAPDGQWKEADAKVSVTSSTMERFERLYKNKFDLQGSLKKHFGKALPTSLTWREWLAALYMRKDGVPTPPYYEVPNAEPVLPTFSDTVAEELVTLYAPNLEDQAQKELVRLISKLPDPYCLKPLVEAGLTIANCYDQYEALTTVLSNPEQAPKTKDELNDYLTFIINEATATP